MKSINTVSQIKVERTPAFGWNYCDPGDGV